MTTSRPATFAPRDEVIGTYRDDGQGFIKIADPADPRLLLVDLAAADIADRGLMRHLNGRIEPYRELLMILSVVTWSSGSRPWMTSEEGSRRFGVSRLLPIFERPDGRGAAVLATELEAEAVGADVWVAGHEGIPVEGICVTGRRSMEP